MQKVFSIAALLLACSTSTQAASTSPPSICKEIVTVSVTDLEFGKEKQIEWCGFGVRIVRRSVETVAQLLPGNSLVQDPRSKISTTLVKPSCANCISRTRFTESYYRSIKKPYFVSLTHSPYLGCYVHYFPKGPSHHWPNGELVPLGNNWLGGYYDPCNDVKFDEAGRSLIGSPKSSNLFLPHYRVNNDGTITVGVQQNDLTTQSR
jgi:ubiquinol-cytochrome c reductase iron-sulfur subunit